MATTRPGNARTEESAENRGAPEGAERGCSTGVTVHICCPPIVHRRRGIAYCPTCRARKRYVAELAEWYGWTETCCGCGDRWQDGERCERPFECGWRKRAIARARKLWDDIGRHAAGAEVT